MSNQYYEFVKVEAGQPLPWETGHFTASQAPNKGICGSTLYFHKDEYMRQTQYILRPASPPAGFTEEQLREAIELAQMKNTLDGTYRYDAPMMYTPDEIISKLKS